MSNLLSVNIYAVHSAAPDKLPVTIEAVGAHHEMPAYYRLTLCGVSCVITDAHRLQILDCLSSAPPLPKPEQECECRVTGDMADASECEVHRG